MSFSIKDAVKVEIKDRSACAKEAVFTLPKEAVDQLFADALKVAQKHAQLPGFRVGKAPLGMVKARYQAMILEDVERMAQQQAFEKMGAETQFDVIGYGDLKAENKPSEGADYTFSIELEVAPEVKLPDYKTLAVSEPELQSIEEKEKAQLEYFQQINSSYGEIGEKPAEKGDMLKVSYESDFELPADAAPALARAVRSDESWLWLSEPEQMPGMNAALVGAVKGGEYKVTSVFPDDWREEGLRGKTVVYTVKVHEGQRKEPMTDPAKIAEKMGLESTEKLQEMIRKQAERELEMEKVEKQKEEMLTLLLDKTPGFEMPEGIRSSFVQREFSRIAEQLVRSEKDVEAFKSEQEKHLADAKEAAEKKLRKFFVIRAVAKEEKISVSREEMDQQIRAICSYTGYKEADLRKHLEEGGGELDLQSDILASKVLLKLVGKD